MTSLPSIWRIFSPEPLPPAPKEPAMAAPTKFNYSSTPDVSVLNGALNELAAKVQRLTTQLDDLERFSIAQTSYLKLLEDRVQVLEQAAPKPKPVDDTNERILTYLGNRVPGEWMNITSIAANTGLDSNVVGGRLSRLAKVPGSRVERLGGKGTGSASLYRVVPPPSPEA